MVSTRSASSALTPGLPPTTPHRTRAAAAATAWSHTPTRLTLLWLAVSLPLVTWDVGYVLLRPHTMPGGRLHWPLWAPYKLYGEIDHIYGWKAWNSHNGFTAGQSALNVVETLMYAAYWWLWYSGGGGSTAGGRKARRAVVGRRAGLAVAIGFAAAVMTLSKTVLYWVSEYFSGFDNIGHNNAIDLLLLWIIPNGAWIVVPAYIVYQLGGEIVDGLAIASSVPKSAKAE